MPTVAIIGTRGYPSYYGGFETAIRKLAPYLANQGWDVTVYGRRDATRPDDRDADSRVATRVTKGLETKSLSTLSYGFTSTLDTASRRPDVALVMNVANGYFLPLLKARGVPTLVNVDGVEWERAKWSPLARRVFRRGANFTAKWATDLVFDSLAIEKYWHDTFSVGGRFIPYGGDVPPALPVPQGLAHRSYVLMVARLVPENSVPQFFQAIPAIAVNHPVVIVGSSGYGGEWDEAARKLANHPGVTWLGQVSNDDLLLALWQHAGVYFHGHSVGGTNPALVQAMAAGAPVLARDTVYNREVLGPEGEFVAADPAEIVETVHQLMADETKRDKAAEANIRRAKQHYSWTKVCADYERALRDLLRR
ncbi:glycosyltransferase [Mycolicibacterium stellerae]|uniref:glycosyltransferase n=1 Tax=Mycolicibacterium stellerae TaxID=2358193 RepID=UPI000F0BAEAF|nr:glycosyltransferase [Mycolicibacterium stellerae]